MPVNGTMANNREGTAPPASIPSFSIRDALKTGAVKQQVVTPQKEPSKVEERKDTYIITETRPFTQEQLNTAWEMFASRYKDDEPRMHCTLTACQPVLKDNYQVEFTVNNPLQEEEVLKIKPALVTFLTKELANGKIDLATCISEAPQGNKRFYTDKEKFDHMAEKNPNILKFKQQFGLDFS